jgi:hypothetical protein
MLTTNSIYLIYFPDLILMDSVTIEEWRPVLSGDTEQDLASLRELNGEINRLDAG